MSPKEQAEKLVDIFYKRYAATDTCFGICEKNSDICDGTGHGCGLWKQYAKESAIICVEQIIEGIESVIGDQKHMWREGEAERHQYYTKELEQIKNS